MGKDAYYFSHDSSAHSDPKITNMLMELKAEGYGVYWVIIEMLRSDANYVLNMSNCNAIAYQAHSTIDVVQKVLQNYGLFTTTDSGDFWSESLVKRMEHLNAKRAVLSINAKKRWSNAKAMQKHKPSECSKVKQSKVKQSKVKEVNNNKTLPRVSLFSFNPLWDKYPKKQGKHEALIHFNAQIKNQEDYDKICKAMDNFLCSDIAKGEYRFIPMGSTWFNHRWEDFINVENATGKSQAVLDVERLMEDARKTRNAAISTAG